ncbi:MAG: site-2 protease family protein [Reyranellaceae bacterium]
MMGWSLSLGRFADTEVRIHFTFLLLVAWFGIAAALQGGPAAGLSAVVFILAIFGCVVLHEYGHVLTARHFGIATRDITLLPIGGVASAERMPERPGQELLVALAGPAVNGAIAVVLIVAFGADLDPKLGIDAVDNPKVDFATRLAVANVMLGLFNLIPAFPMDGGRVLRALLSLRLDRVRATRIAAQIGQALAFALGFLGLFGNPILVFVALFIFLAASQETYATELEDAAKDATVQAATITAFSALGVQSTVSQAVERLLSSSQREFPVTDGRGRLNGVLTREGMIRALSERGPDTPVVEVMERDVTVVSHRAPLGEAVAKLQGSRQPLVGVVDDEDRVVGIVTLENLAEYLMVAQAGRERRKT